MKTIIIFLVLASVSLSLSGQKLAANENEALLKITVSDFADKPRINDVVILSSAKTGKDYQCITDNKGTSEILLPEGDTYRISYKIIDKNEEYDSLIIPELPGMITSNLIIKYEMPKTITLDNVYFDFDRSSIQSASYATLDDLAAFMKLKGSMTIEIAGHTDNIGNSEYNLKLSQARAEAVRNYLIAKGIAASRIIAKGYGDSAPVASNDSDDGRQKNRRTEVKILSE